MRQSWPVEMKWNSVSVSLQPGAKVHPDVLSELVRPSIDYVRHKRFRSGNFPSSLSNESDRLVHWCHGAPGVIHMLIMAHKVRLVYALYYVVHVVQQHQQFNSCLIWPDIKALALWDHPVHLKHMSNTGTLWHGSALHAQHIVLHICWNV